MSSHFNREQLAQGAAELGIQLSESQIEKLISFCVLLETTNRTMNLTRIPPEEYVPLHLLDSLSIVKAVSPASFPSLLDAGTGAGFPGVALAIAFPALEVLLVDSTRKKLNFLEEASAALKLPNVRVMHARMEALGRDRSFRDSRPFITARALARLEPLAKLILPVLEVDGTAVAYKGPGAEEELRTAERIISDLGCSVERIVPVNIPGSDAARSLIVIEKRAETPSKYPRTTVR